MHPKAVLAGAISIALLMCCCTPRVAMAKGRAKVSPDAAAASPSAKIQVVIQYNVNPGSTQYSNIRVLGGTVTRQFNSINALGAKISQSLLNQLVASDPSISYISVDRALRSRGDDVQITAPDYFNEPINSAFAWESGFVGTNVGIAVIDSGMQSIPDLGTAAWNALPPNQPASLRFPYVPDEAAPGNYGRIVYSQNFVPNANDALDRFGHGTHVAGLIAGNGAQSTGKNFVYTYRGVAPNANLINLRVLDQNGAGTDSSVIAAIEQAIALKSTFNIRIINLSLGRPIFESYALDPLCQAVEQAWKAGIVVVVAAGNDGRDLNLNAEGYGTINSPGNDPYAITVGAMRSMETPTVTDDLIASYSSKGPSFIDDVAKPDIVAPGNLVISLRYWYDSLAIDNPSFITPYSFYEANGDPQPSRQYFPLSGTSMATAVTSGAIADLLAAYPKLTPDQVKAVLMANAQRSYFPQTSSVIAEGVTYLANYDVFTIGAGYLDLEATLKYLSTNGPSLIPAGTAMSPIAVYDATSGDTTLVADPTALWGQNGTWEASDLYGDNAFETANGSAILSGTTAIWGQTAIWGKDDPSAFSGLFGSTGLWGKGTPNAQTVLWGKDTGNTTSLYVPFAY